MSTLLDAPAGVSHRTAAERLRTSMAAVRVSLSWLGVRKTLTPEQKAQAAESFGAEGQFLSAGKKLLDTSHPAFKAVTSVRTRLLSYWRGLTLPYPDPGVRLIRQADVTPFNEHMTTLQHELTQAVEFLDRDYAQLRRAAGQRLGTLFNPADYPQSLRRLFSVEWDYPSIEPPDDSRQLNPELYARTRPHGRPFR